MNIRNQFCREALVWRQLKHPNILPLLGVNSDLFSPSFCLISPWMKNKDIITYLKANPVEDVYSVLSDIAAGIRYLHSQDPPIVHGDIRGANILVTDDFRCCLADFGLSVISTESQAWTIATSNSLLKGAIHWLAPEYISPNASPKVPHTSRDIYAFGCTIVEVSVFLSKCFFQ
ncbi:kinase-like domain-containing protein [Rhodocollybia butyracea]|uniref:Kinase-like domain-containing protein n=1 Tax=Rhodocollybia butyracea TaxID=206335 RepID=A0A9P5PMZ0_9AGAR|nr:kinase-like domain-containing protein [Rhodocollybia butyracea]